MRLHLGPVPEDPAFDPAGDGWVRLREPRPGLLISAAIPLVIVMAAGVLLVWSLIVRFEAPAGSFSVTIPLSGLLAAGAALLSLVLLHELLHALPAALAGSWREVVLGFSPRHLAPYAAYSGALTREAQLVTGATPFVFLTLLSFAVGAVFPGVVWWMVALSVVNALGSAADILMLALIWRQVPRGAVMRDQGFATWWRPAG